MFGNPMSKSLCCLEIFLEQFVNNDGNGDSSFMFVLYVEGWVTRITETPQRNHISQSFCYNLQFYLLRSPLAQNYLIRVEALYVEKYLCLTRNSSLYLYTSKQALIIFYETILLALHIHFNCKDKQDQSKPKIICYRNSPVFDSFSVDRQSTSASNIDIPALSIPAPTRYYTIKESPVAISDQSPQLRSLMHIMSTPGVTLSTSNDLLTFRVCHAFQLSLSRVYIIY